MTQFKLRYITIVIGIGSGVYGDKPPLAGNIYTLTNHRVTAEIDACGGETQGTAKVRVYGLTRDLMNALTVMGYVNVQSRAQNSIQILAGSDPDSLSTIYNGVIDTAVANYNEAPDVALEISALSATVAALGLSQPTSFSGSVAVTTIMASIAQKMAWQFDPGDVTGVLTDQTFNGSYLEQIKACAAAADIDAIIEDLNASKRLRLKNHFSYFVNDPSTTISPIVGNMIGYPVFSQATMIIKSTFEPNINLGKLVIIKDSSVTPANGSWIVNSVKHELESYVPNGKWQTTCTIYRAELTQ
jgi:hypothetical protein